LLGAFAHGALPGAMIADAAARRAPGLTAWRRRPGPRSRRTAPRSRAGSSRRRSLPCRRSS
ncbi:MAG: hypothetical protein DYH06_22860, partial [Acidobacteria bacterium ACB2]|nr:hypothetical protein [Acidobacteria bacterium ACB2]